MGFLLLQLYWALLTWTSKQSLLVTTQNTLATIKTLAAQWWVFRGQALFTFSENIKNSFVKKLLGSQIPCGVSALQMPLMMILHFQQQQDSCNTSLLPQTHTHTHIHIRGDELLGSSTKGFDSFYTILNVSSDSLRNPLA